MNIRAYWILLAPLKGERIKVRGFSARPWPLGDTGNPHPALSLRNGEAKESAMKAYEIRYNVGSPRSRKLSELHRIDLTIQRFNDLTLQRANFP